MLSSHRLTLRLVLSLHQSRNSSQFAPLLNCKVQDYSTWIKKKPQSMAVCHLVLKATNQRFYLVCRWDFSSQVSIGEYTSLPEHNGSRCSSITNTINRELLYRFIETRGIPLTFFPYVTSRRRTLILQWYSVVILVLNLFYRMKVFILLCNPD